MAPRPRPCCAATARENRRLRHENRRLRADNARLKDLLEGARRAGKRHAAPFSTGAPKAQPRRPGRRPGAAYGRAAQQWLWVFVTARVTIYAIQPGRGFDEAARILGADFAGVLVRDGWGPSRRFSHATHQTCLGHLWRRCRENLETAWRGTARFPHAVKARLQDALALRDRRARGELSPHGLAVARGRLEARGDRRLGWQLTDEDNRKLVAHLVRERDALFTFLDRPEVPATNWAAEHAIRPAVVTRKVCGGNRTWRGAHTQEVLASVLRTCAQQGHDFYTLTVSLLCAPEPRVAVELLPVARSP